MPQGVPKPRAGKGLAAWRSRQKRGAIMEPSTFQEIKKKAAARGARSSEDVAGAAYWKTAKAKFKEKHHSPPIHDKYSNPDKY